MAYMAKHDWFVIFQPYLLMLTKLSQAIFAISIKPIYVSIT